MRRVSFFCDSMSASAAARNTRSSPAKQCQLPPVHYPDTRRLRRNACREITYRVSQQNAVTGLTPRPATRRDPFRPPRPPQSNLGDNHHCSAAITPQQSVDERSSRRTLALITSQQQKRYATSWMTSIGAAYGHIRQSPFQAVNQHLLDSPYALRPRNMVLA